VDETDRLLAALEPLLAKYRDSRERREAQSLLRALRLAPTLEVFEAIVQTPRSVPRSRLDPEWLRRYGL